ncbi:L,D-transpeptidase family protein [Halomonas pacifica]|uniref:L,D-transpeptidase family protein n=1 Tax=Bisbaumannia pacifica TaxID=77098 RepID=UPI0023597C59|nr:L,D-transpeptidase family protein [Halomonas pacifica]MDC8802612.1 L,D-transpeptidase family protein [Halomonas pacifica]
MTIKRAFTNRRDSTALPLGRLSRRWSVLLAALCVAGLTLPALAQQAPAPDGAVIGDGVEGRDAALVPLDEALNGRLLWQDEAALGRLDRALTSLAEDGLTPAHYRADTWRQAFAALPAEDAAARERLAQEASRALAQALEDLARGRVDPRRLDPRWEIPLAEASLPWPAIAAALAAGRVDEALTLARPEHPAYGQLRQALAEHRRLEALGGWAPLPPRSAALRPGERHEEVRRLRERLAAAGELGALVPEAGLYGELAARARPAGFDSLHYDEPLVAAVRRFQRRHGLNDDGVVGPRTRDALNVPVSRRIEQLRLGLERARWWLPTLAGHHILVNVAGQTLDYRRPNGETWRTRVIVGQPRRPTPLLASRVTHFDLHPSWTVPPTIFREDKLPQLRQDPLALEGRFSVLAPDGTPLDPEEVDWQNPGPVMLRQAPGPANPLGQMVLRFPNGHAVYLHDTPGRGLFGRDQRLISSGCIRVEGVRRLVEQLLADTGTRVDLAAWLAGGESQTLHLARSVPLYLYYWTAYPAPGGEVIFHSDPYGRDARLAAALARG